MAKINDGRERRQTWKYLIRWVPELAILTLVLHYSLQWGIVLAVVEIVSEIFRLSNYLAKTIRVFQVVNENRLSAIMERLEVTDDDVKRIFDGKVAPHMTETQLAELDKDFTDLGL